MRMNNMRITALAFVIPILFLWPACARAQAAKAPYPVMAPPDQYLIPDEKAEIALARSSAPESISNPRGYYVRIGKKRATRAGSGSDVLHDGEAAVPERRRHELASHLMFFVSDDAVKSWGANSPVIAGNDPEERVTVFMVLAATWSDG